jgi:hypothetical protein
LQRDASQNVRIEHPVHSSPLDAQCQRVQRLMWAATGPEPIEKASEVDLVNLVEDRHHSPLSGRTVARSGLRMMPMFPLSPLSFRTAGFPSTAGRLAFQVVPLFVSPQVKPAPGMPCAPRRIASTLHALRCPTLRPALCRNSGFGGALPFEESTPLPQRSSLRSGFYCPSPSTLNRPHPSHSQAHPDFAA